MEKIVSDSENTKKYIAVGIILVLLAILGVTMFSAFLLVQDKDKAVMEAQGRLATNNTDFILIGEYNAAVREYKGATAYFPGTLIAKVTQYKVDKWELKEDGSPAGSLFTAVPGTFKPVL